MTAIPFAVMSYKHDSLPLSAQDCVNLYVESQPKTAKTFMPLFGSPGITTFATAGNGPLRGLHNFDDILYAVSGNRFYRIDEDGTATDLGGNVDGTDPIQIADNGDQMLLVNGVKGYIYDVGGGFRVITDLDFFPSQSVTFLDSFFLLTEPDTAIVFKSSSLDGETYSPDEFATAEMESDDAVAVYAFKDLLYVFGTQTIELWRNAGAANFPFLRIRGSSVKQGLIGPHATTDDDESIFFLGDDGIAYELRGNRKKRISTHALERAWETYSDLSDCKCYSYTYGGHKFITFNFPSGNRTFSYDISTSMWHRRESRDQFDNDLGSWRINSTVRCYKKQLFGDLLSGQIGELDESVYQEFGNTIIGTAISPPIHGDGSRLTMPWFEMDVDTGVGVTSGQGSDPQIMLSISDNGGRSFDNQELWSSIGKIGEYDGTAYQVRWDRLGGFFERYMKISISDPVRRTIKGARAPGLKARVGF